MDGSTDANAVTFHHASRLGEPDVLDRIAHELQAIGRRGGIERTLAIGELVLNRFFGGDPTVWRDRRRNKNNSIRRLADHQDCPFSKSALSEAVAVFVAALELPCVRTSGHIGAAHVMAVMGLPAADREPMLAAAEREHQGVREFRQRVVEMRRAQGEKRGRPVREPATQNILRIRASIAQALAALRALAATSLDADAREQLCRMDEDLALLRNLASDLAEHHLGVAQARHRARTAGASDAA